MSYINEKYRYIWRLLKDVVKQLIKEKEVADHLYDCNCVYCAGEFDQKVFFIHELRIQAIHINLRILCRRFLTDMTAADSLLALIYQSMTYSIMNDDSFDTFQLLTRQLLSEVVDYLYKCANHVSSSIQEIHDEYEILATYPFITLYSPQLKIDPLCHISIRLYREVITPLYRVICQNLRHFNSMRIIYNIFAAGFYKGFVIYSYHPIINPIPKCTIDPNLVLHFLRNYPTQKTHLRSLFLLFTRRDIYEFCKLCIQEHDLKSINVGINMYTITHYSCLLDNKLFYTVADTLLSKSKLCAMFMIEMARLGCDQKVSFIRLLSRRFIVKKKCNTCITFPDFKISKRCYVSRADMFEIWQYVKILIRYHLAQPLKKILIDSDYKLIVNYNNQLLKHK